MRLVSIGLSGVIGAAALFSYPVDLLLAAEEVVRQVRGVVEAVNPMDTPPVIVVRSRTGSKDEAVVGAVIKQGIPIIHGGKHVGMKQIRIGDHVTLTYKKSREGLMAQSITIHGQ
ncbi:MAG: hypothetical protein ABW047_17700 [Nitrospiraceae bacterium]